MRPRLLHLRPGEGRYALFLAAACLVVLLFDVLTPAPVDWTQSYERADDRPFGMQILWELLPDLFPGAAVRASNLPPYLVLQDTAHAPLNYVFVTRAFEPDAAEAAHLLRFAARGNAVFVAAEAMRGALADTLGVRTSAPPGLPRPESPLGSAADSTQLRFTDEALRTDDGYAYHAGTADAVFSRFDAGRAAVLAADDAGRPVFLRVPYGSGAFYLSTTPLAFTNFYVLYADNARYAYTALSHLPVRDVLWDAYYKPFSKRAQTPLRFILAHPALRAGYLLLLAGVVLFVASQARRRQRAIPVAPPPRNDTVDFVETVGRLYLAHADHAGLARRRAAYFLDYVRTHLRVDPGAAAERPPPPHVVEQVAARSGVSAARVEAVFEAVRRAHGAPVLRAEDLRDLSLRIDAFYRAARR